MPLKSKREATNRDTELFDLTTLFSTDDSDEEFFGFEDTIKSDNIESRTAQQELESLFATDDDASEFLGFNSSSDLKSIFYSEETDDEEFLGFWIFY